MSVALWCLLILALLPYLLAGVSGIYRIRQPGGFDNNNPRAQYASLEGVGARAWAAQQNAWESLALFTATLAVAHFAGVAPAQLATASLLFLATRILHAVCYIADLATLRSVATIVGLFSCLYIFYLAIMI